MTAQRCDRTKPASRVLSGMLIAFILWIQLGRVPTPVHAQLGEDLWSVPANLSRSGAASAPVMISQPDGSLRIFWWDTFDGLTMVEGMPDEWTAPIATPIVLVEALERPAPGGERFAYTPIDRMPRIVGDSLGRSHSFWLGAPDAETEARPLLHAWLDQDDTDWSVPRALAESAVGFDVTRDISGTLHLAYIRDRDTEAFPAGIYYAAFPEGSIPASGSSSPIDTSRYYRLPAPEEAHIEVVGTGSGAVGITWQDPHLSRAMLGISEDGGETWLEPQPIGEPDGAAQRGRIFAHPTPSGEALWLLWEDVGFAGACSRYQAPASQIIEEPEARREQVLESLTFCPEPEDEQVLTLGAQTFLLGADPESDLLTLAVWDGEQWSEPRTFRFNFEDPSTDRGIFLGDLQSTIIQPPPTEADQAMEPSFAVAGVDDRGDVWITTSRISAVELTFAPPPPWSEPEPVSEGILTPDLPVITVDPDGNVHVMYAAKEAPNARTSLFYATWDGSRWTRPALVLRAPDGSAGSPSLTTTGEYLHAVWTAGPNGQAFYSRAFLRDAYVQGGWMDPQVLPGPTAEWGTGSSPQIVRSSRAGGALHVVYAVPVNEARGLYYTRSTDEGETWAPVSQVFDGVEAGWTRVEAPRLVIDPQGVLHLIWARASLSADDVYQSIVYARSEDEGKTWSEPFEVAEGTFVRPDLALTGAEEIHLIYREVGAFGSWWHRRLDVHTAAPEESTAAWSRTERIQALSDISEPVGLTGNGADSLYAVGTRQEEPRALIVRYTRWDGESWSPAETQSFDLESTALGAAVAVHPQAGRLDLLLGAERQTEEGETEEALWHTSRAVPAVDPDVYTVETPAPTPVPPTPSPTSTPRPSPTPTPDLNLAAPPASQSSMSMPVSLMIAGGVAALIVIGIFGLSFVWTGRR